MRMRRKGKKVTNPFDRILEAYRDYQYTNDKLLENFQPNKDYSLEYLETRAQKLEASISAIEYTKEYITSKDTLHPEPPW